MPDPDLMEGARPEDIRDEQMGKRRLHAKPEALAARSLGDMPGHPISLVGEHAAAYAAFQRACVGLKEAQAAYAIAQGTYRDALEAFSRFTEAAAK